MRYKRIVASIARVMLVILLTLLALVCGKFIFDLAARMGGGTFDPVPPIVASCAVLSAAVILFLPLRLKKIEAALLIFPAFCLLWSLKHVIAEGATLCDLYRLTLGIPHQHHFSESVERMPSYMLSKVAAEYFRTSIFYHFSLAVSAATAVFCLAGRQRRRNRFLPPRAAARMILGHLLSLSPPVFFLLSGVYFGTKIVSLWEVLTGFFDFDWSTYILIMMLVLAVVLELMVISLSRLEAGTKVHIVATLAMFIATIAMMQFVTALFAAETAASTTSVMSTPFQLLESWWIISPLATTAAIWTAPVFHGVVLFGAIFSIYGMRPGTLLQMVRRGLLVLLVAAICLGPEMILAKQLEALLSPERDGRCDNLDEWPRLLQRLPLDDFLHRPRYDDPLFQISNLDPAVSTALPDSISGDYPRLWITRKEIRLNDEKIADLSLIETNSGQKKIERALKPSLDALRREIEKRSTDGWVVLDETDRGVPLVLELVAERSLKMGQIQPALSIAEKVGFRFIRLLLRSPDPPHPGPKRCPEVVRIPVIVNSSWNDESP